MDTISYDEFLKAQQVILQYNIYQKKYLKSIKLNIDNKIFESGIHNSEDVLRDTDLSTRTLNGLYANLDKPQNVKLSYFQGYKKSDLLKFKNLGKKSINEFEKLLNSAKVFLS